MTDTLIEILERAKGDPNYGSSEKHVWYRSGLTRAQELVKQWFQSESPSEIPVITDDAIKAMISELDYLGREYDHYEYGLPQDEENVAKMVAIVRASLPSSPARESVEVELRAALKDVMATWMIDTADGRCLAAQDRANAILNKTEIEGQS